MRLIEAIRLGDFFPVGWFFRNSRVQHQVAQVRDDLPASRVKDIRELFEAARNSKALTDVEAYLRAIQGANAKVVLEIQFPGIDLISVIAGRIENVYWTELPSKDELTIRFVKFDEDDRDLARTAAGVITGGDLIRHNPMYTVYFRDDTKIHLGVGQKFAYLLRGIHQSTEFSNG